MNQEQRRKLIGLAALFLASVGIAAGLFSLSYRYDNKYTAPGPQPFAGVLLLNEDDLEQHPVIWLVRDWEIYRDRLLTPADLTEGLLLPDELVFIGQYGGFEGRVLAGLPVRSPHGSATYRLNLALPAETRSYTLELPEIFSAYRLYLNGTLMQSMGDTEPIKYQPETGITSVTIQAAEQLEILLAVTDYSHFYSGLVYPPAFGEPSAVARIMNQRLSGRTLICAIALGIGGAYLLIGIGTRHLQESSRGQVLPLLYSALCFTFILYVCHPVIKSLQGGGMLLYRLEAFAYCALLLLIILIQGRLTASNREWTLILSVFGATTCALSLLIPFLMGDNLNLMLAYSHLISFYTWTCAAYLTLNIFFSFARGTTDNLLLLIGIGIFDAALIMDRLLPLFEPIRGGWFIELAGGTLVLLIGITLTQGIATHMRVQLAVKARTESILRMLEVQRAYHPVLLEKEHAAQVARHDLRHHITILSGLLADGELTKLGAYLDTYSDKQIQPLAISYCQHYVIDMLLRLYAGLCESRKIEFRVEATLPQTLAIADDDLCVILSNLLENALEASLLLPPEERMISIRIGSRHSRLIVLVENRFDGKVVAEYDRFFSRKRKNRQGLGLASVQAIVGSYDGQVNFYPAGGIFHSEVFIPNRPEGTKAEERTK